VKNSNLEIGINLKDIEAELARRSFREFVRFTKEDYEFNWHHELLCQKLQAFAEKKIKRLMIFVPPRHGKSELASRKLPAWIFGINPNARIIGTSYGSELASLFNRDVQRTIDSYAYREVFPQTRLSESNIRTAAFGTYIRNSDQFEIVGKKGSYRSAGVGGPITGTGGDYLILDDPYKNSEEAESPTVRRKVWEWYTSTFYTRQEKDASIMIIQTRWHEMDLSGSLLQAMKKGDEFADQWEVVSLPAIMDMGQNRNPDDPRLINQALWENKYSIDWLKKTKGVLGTRQFSALYQQDPRPGDGTMIKSQWMKYYTRKPERFEKIIQSWDMAFGGKVTSDFVVGSIYGKSGSEFYLLDQVRGQMDFPDTIRAFKMLSQKWPAAITKLVEAKANGQAVIDSLKKEISGIVPVNPSTSKLARLNAVIGLYEAGNVYYPSPEVHHWVEDHVEEMLAFPLGSKDDRVDAETQALNYFNKSGIGSFTKEMTEQEPSEKLGEW
jgi:predicted phage terminase large subunit-like protein